MAELDPKRFYVYLHTFADGSVYLGKGSWSRAYHFGDQRRGVLWLRAKNKYGRPKVTFIAKNLEEEFSYYAEEEAISHYRQLGYKMRNLSSGGTGGQSGLTGERSANYGRKKSPELIAHYRKIMSGEGNPRHGAKLTDETKRRISEARIGTDIYTFQHKSGDEFTGTRYEFRVKYGFSLNQMFCKNPREIWRGWRVAPSPSYQN